MAAWIVRIAITALLFGLILRHVDLGQVGATLGQVEWIWLLPALLLQLLAAAIAAFRWHRIMHVLRFGHSYLFYLRSFFKGMFFNQGLPTSIGGDALRILDVAREGHGKREAFYGVAVDRAAGLIGLLVFNLGAFALWPELLPQQVALPILLLLALGCASFVLFSQLHRVGLLAQLPGARWLHELSQRLSTVFSDLGGWGQQLLLSGWVHFFTVLSVWCVGRGVGLPVGLAAFMVIVPPVLLLTVVPISLAGWGVREGGFIGLFLLVGADEGRVLSMSLLFGLLLIVASLPGLVFYLTGRHRL